MPNILRRQSYLCTLANQLSLMIMKKTTALSSLLLLGGLGYLTAQLAKLNLTFHLHGEEDHHYL